MILTITPKKRRKTTSCLGIKKPQNNLRHIEKCPHCGSDNLSLIEGKGARAGIYCHACNTVFKCEDMSKAEQIPEATLTRETITSLLQTNFGLERMTARNVLNFTINAIKAALNSGSQVRLRGFGRFDKKISPPKNVTNFKTNERIRLDSAPTIRFKPSKSWLKRMDNKD